MFSGARGGVAFTKHLSVFMHSARVGLHESAVLERRDASKGVGVYARDALDAGTCIAVVPHDKVITTKSLQACGCSYVVPPAMLSLDLLPHASDGSSNLALVTTAKLNSEPSSACDFSPPCRFTKGVVSSLLGCERDLEWVELAWRLGTERCGSHSYWWGWIDSVPKGAELAAAQEACGSALRARFPEYEGVWRRWGEAIHSEVDLWYSKLEEHVLMLPWEVFVWAVRILLSQGSTVVGSFHGDDGEVLFRKQLGILPIIDVVNASPTSFIPNFEALLGDFIDDAAPSAKEQRLTQTFLQLQSRENPFFFSSSTSGKRMLSAVQASQCELPSAVIEVASSWEELPRWYQELIVAGTLETERAQCIGMTSQPLEQPPCGSAALSGLFPAYALTTTRDLRSGDEVLLQYESPNDVSLVSDTATVNHAMSLWLKYNFVV